MSTSPEPILPESAQTQARLARGRLDVVVLASGRGTNFAALLAAQNSGALPIRVNALLCDRRSAPVLEIAELAGIPAIALRPRDFPDRTSFDHTLFARVAEYSPALIVLAGYMRVIDPAIVEAWHGRMINVHPSLLPKYPGLHTHQRVLDSGEPVHGASVHYVTAELDGGPVIAQALLAVLGDDTADSLARRLLPLEHRLLVGVVDLIARHRVALVGDRIMLDRNAIPEPLRLASEGSQFEI